MSRGCGCNGLGETCSCVIRGELGVDVSGTGGASDPYVFSIDQAFLEEKIAEGGGGGGSAAPIGAAEVYSTAVPYDQGFDSEAAGSWNVAPHDPHGAGDVSWLAPNGTTDRLILDIGWYTIDVVGYAVLPSGSTALGGRLAINCGASISGNAEVTDSFVVESSGVKVLGLTIHAGPLYSDGTAYIRPLFRWDGWGAQPLPTSAYLSVYAVKLS